MSIVLPLGMAFFQGMQFQAMDSGGRSF
jgi:hypothetical protein